MATHPNVLAWRIPGTGEPGGLPSMGSHRVRHDWSDLAAAAAAGGQKVEAVTDFIFLGSKITVDGDCSPDIKWHLFLGRKAITNIDSIFKSRDITLLINIHLVKAITFLVVTDVRVGPLRRLSIKELMLLNCGAGEDCWKFLGQQGDQTSQS